MSDVLPKGPCPEEDKLFTVVQGIINNEGAQNLTFKALRIRVESELKLDMEAHKGAISKAAEKAVKAPRTLKKLQDYHQERTNGTLVSAGQGKSRSSKGSKKSSSKRSSSASRAKKEKKEKDADYKGPKKPLTAFFYFTGDVRQKVRDEHPEFTMGELGKHFGLLWGEMSEEEKAPYVTKNLEAQAEYVIACEEFVAGGGALKGRGGKAKPEREGPKKPLGAYFMFIAAKRPEWTAEGLSVTEIAKKGGALWSSMSAAEKQIYEDKKAQDTLRYLRECEEQGFDPKTVAKKSSGKKRATATKRNRSGKKVKKEKGGDDSSVSSFSSDSSSDSSDSSDSGSSSGSSSLSSDSSSVSSDSSDTDA